MKVSQINAHGVCIDYKTVTVVAPKKHKVTIEVKVAKIQPGVFVYGCYFNLPSDSFGFGFSWAPSVGYRHQRYPTEQAAIIAGLEDIDEGLKEKRAGHPDKKRDKIIGELKTAIQNAIAAKKAFGDHQAQNYQMTLF